MFRGVSAFDRHQQLTGCPNLAKNRAGVLGYQEDVTGQLRQARARLIEEGKRHLQDYEHPKLGYTFWGWNL
jgi:hypothetical protein